MERVHLEKSDRKREGKKKRLLLSDDAWGDECNNG